MSSLVWAAPHVHVVSRIRTSTVATNSLLAVGPLLAPMISRPSVVILNLLHHSRSTAGTFRFPRRCSSPSAFLAHSVRSSRRPPALPSLTRVQHEFAPREYINLARLTSYISGQRAHTLGLISTTLVAPPTRKRSSPSRGRVLLVPESHGRPAEREMEGKVHFCASFVAINSSSCDVLPGRCGGCRGGSNDPTCLRRTAAECRR